MFRSMLILCAAAMLTMVTASCSNDVVPKAEELAERACACETAECAKEVNAEVESFLRDATGERLSERDEKRLNAAANQIGTCIATHAGTEAVVGDDRDDDDDDDHDHDH